MAKNEGLLKANKEKKDEFYTQLSDIANELKHYKDHFRGKVVLCNCDDPYESNFTKYFLMMFNEWGLKKLICTCWNGSPITGKELDLFGEKPTQDSRSKIAYKVELSEVKDLTGDGVATLEDVQLYLQEHKPTRLQGNGDFRSQECIELLKEADIVVTNPPFSLFREYVAQLVEYDKKFLIIGNKNAVVCKEVFPLLKENKLWTGYRSFSGGMWFISNYEGKTEKYEDGQKLINVPAIWFTNLDHKKRHYPIDLYKHYTPEEYPKYINYDAIEVKQTADIPMDYDGVMGVPITFLDKYCPEQFEIVGITNGGELGIMCGVSANLTERECRALFEEDKSFRRGKVYYRDPNGKLVGCYARILIRKKQ